MVLLNGTCEENEGQSVDIGQLLIEAAGFTFNPVGDGKFQIRDTKRNNVILARDPRYPNILYSGVSSHRGINFIPDKDYMEIFYDEGISIIYTGENTSEDYTKNALKLCFELDNDIYYDYYNVTISNKLINESASIVIDTNLCMSDNGKLRLEFIKSPHKYDVDGLHKIPINTISERSKFGYNDDYEIHINEEGKPESYAYFIANIYGAKTVTGKYSSRYLYLPLFKTSSVDGRKLQPSEVIYYAIRNLIRLIHGCFDKYKREYFSKRVDDVLNAMRPVLEALIKDFIDYDFDSSKTNAASKSCMKKTRVITDLVKGNISTGE